MRGPARMALTWLTRRSLARGVDAEFRASGHIPGSKAAADAVVLASKLVGDGIDEEAALAQLRSMPGGQRALRDAALMMARYADGGYPQAPTYRLLRAAAGEPVDPPDGERVAAEAGQRQLLEQPLETSFTRLAEQLPALRELAERMRESPRPESMAAQLRTLEALHDSVNRVVGPDSRGSDPVLTSEAASDIAYRYLVRLTGINSRTWRLSDG